MRIYLVQHIPSVFVKKTWIKIKCLLDIHLRFKNILYYTYKIAVKQHPTVLGGLAYQLADCAANQLQRRFQSKFPMMPPSRLVPFLWWMWSSNNPTNNWWDIYGEKPMSYTPSYPGEEQGLHAMHASWLPPSPSLWSTSPLPGALWQPLVLRDVHPPPP